MPIITSIKAQKNQKRVNINLDGAFGFGLDLENFFRLGLKVNQELIQEEINEIIKKAEFQKCLDKTINFAMVRPRSTKEVKDYFRKKEIDKSIQQTIIDRLIKLELLDDQKFAKWWVEQRLAFRPKSQRIMNYELRMKGIKQNIIDEVLENTEIDEVKIAKELIAKKIYKWQKYDEKVRKQKISQYLAGKGFNWDVINSVVDLI
ncbi:MAG: hypothetical protein ACD_19C00429G0016 [uncultured bacterium]|nr:MAG: hypothetical protein ACD_19C00429G0016 [uncultured bacterium]